MAGLSHLRAQLLTWNFKNVVLRDDGVEAEAYHRVFGVNVYFPLDQFIQVSIMTGL